MNNASEKQKSSQNLLPDHPAAAQLLTVVAASENGIDLETLRRKMQQKSGLEPTETADLAEQMRQRDLLKRDDKGQFHTAKQRNLVEGKLFINRAGNGFVEEPGGDTLAFIPASQVGMALNGDRVLVALAKGQEKGSGGTGRLPEGKVITVLERGRSRLTGTVRNTHKGLILEPADPGIRRQFGFTHGDIPKPGTRVAASLDVDADSPSGLQVTVQDIIGPEEDARTDRPLILAEYDLEPRFPEKVEQEARQAKIDEKSIGRRRDLRDHHVITIDPESAKDFDDALSLRRLNRDTWEICVHIADVSHFVQPDSALDEEAYRRGCSVYLPDLVIPMLPEALSNDLCSLKPDVDRFAFSAMLRVRESGELLSVKFAETVIRSRCRLTYEQAAAVLHGSSQKGEGANALDDTTVTLLKDLNRFSQSLRKRRMKSGALDMATDEVQLVLDDKGHIKSLRPVEYDQAHQLIEEFMLLANEAACLTLERAGLEQLHRNHPEPEAAKLSGIAEQLNQAGVARSQDQSEPTLQSLLERVAGRHDRGAWTSVMLRALPKAEYSAEAEGHYGLAKAFYAHFTSPIRRYPDLVTHRLLKAMLTGAGQVVPKDHLHAIASQCSEKERTAQRAERHLVDMKLLRHLRRKTAKGKQKQLSGTVMNAHNAGTQIYLPDYRIVGWLPSSRRSDKRMTTGQHVQVVPSSIDVTRCDLELKPAT